MQKYKLKNIKTGEEHLCDKVTIDGFDYYVTDKRVFENGIYAQCSFTGNISKVRNGQIAFKVIATNNPNIDIAQVVDEVEILAQEKYPKWMFEIAPNIHCHNELRNAFIEGFNEAKETHPFSEEDIIEFVKWYKETLNTGLRSEYKSTNELFKLWGEQRTKTIYYE